VDDRAAKWLDGLYGPHQGWSNEMHDALAAEFAAVRREERERCAKACECVFNSLADGPAAKNAVAIAAAAIRVLTEEE